jgi:hypothetical protein
VPARHTGQPGDYDWVLPLTRAVAACLPARLDHVDAWRLLFAIGWQESRWQARHQHGGPASGFLQFEVAGVAGVLAHASTARLARRLLATLRYSTLDPVAIQRVLADNDVLALGFGRLLLWTLPDPLPGPQDARAGWAQYLAAWRPGRPRPETWAEAWARALVVCPAA